MWYWTLVCKWFPVLPNDFLVLPNMYISIHATNELATIIRHSILLHYWPNAFFIILLEILALLLTSSHCLYWKGCILRSLHRLFVHFWMIGFFRKLVTSQHNLIPSRTNIVVVVVLWVFLSSCIKTVMKKKKKRKYCNTETQKQGFLMPY